jgi:pyrimidine precursor biosynthesis enzyme
VHETNISATYRPYHAPVFLAQSKGYFAEQGIKVALLTPQDPSDVTEIIGSGKVSTIDDNCVQHNHVAHSFSSFSLSQVDMGAKAMIHTIAGKARGFPIKSIGTMMDEPFTGLVYLKDSGITAFKDIKGRKIGYVGEFGKVQVSVRLSWRQQVTDRLIGTAFSSILVGRVSTSDVFFFF